MFANPIFIYFLSSFFTQSDIARQAVNFLYLIVGLVLPLVFAFLQIGTDTMVDIVKIAKWFILPIPVFSTCFGVYQIILRNLLAIVFIGKEIIKPADIQLDDSGAPTLDPFDILVAREMLLFLILSIPFYWLLLAAIEGRLFSICRPAARPAPPSQLAGYEIDEDIIEEEQRVENM